LTDACRGIFTLKHTMQRLQTQLQLLERRQSEYALDFLILKLRLIGCEYRQSLTWTSSSVRRL